MARSSRSYALYLVSAVLSFCEKKAIGFQALSTSYWRMAPVPVAEASVTMEVPASGDGKDSMTVSLKDILAVRKAASTYGVQFRVTDWPRLQGLTMA